MITMKKILAAIDVMISHTPEKMAPASLISVYMALVRADYNSGSTGIVKMSYPSIAKLSGGSSPVTVGRAVKFFEQYGFISIQSGRSLKGGGKAVENIYNLNPII